MLVVFVVRVDEPLVLESLFRRRAVPGIRLDQRADEGLGVVRDVLPVLVVAVGRVWSVRMPQDSLCLGSSQFELAGAAFLDELLGFGRAERDVPAKEAVGDHSERVLSVNRPRPAARVW